MQLKYTEQKDLNFILPLIKAEDKAGTIISSTSLINADNIAEFLFRTKQGTKAGAAVSFATAGISLRLLTCVQSEGT